MLAGAGNLSCKDLELYLMDACVSRFCDTTWTILFIIFKSGGG